MLMSIFRRCFGKGSSNDERDELPIASAIQFGAIGVYPVPFGTTGFGVVFEDDGKTGYFYLTNERGDEIFDALCLYNHGDSSRLVPGEEVFVVWSPARKKAGIYFHGSF